MVEYVQLHYRRQRCEEHDLEEEVHTYMCMCRCIWEHNDICCILNIQNASSIYVLLPLAPFPALLHLSLPIPHLS